MRAQKVIVALAVAAICLAGCETVRICNSDGGMEISQNEGGTANVRSDDVCFGEGLSLDGSVLSRNSEGFLVASVELRNHHGDPSDYNRKDPFTLQYRFSWLDANGIEILPDASQWIRKKFYGGEADRLQSSAPRREATRFVLRLRHVR